MCIFSLESWLSKKKLLKSCHIFNGSTKKNKKEGGTFCFYFSLCLITEMVLELITTKVGLLKEKPFEEELV